jgi:hypothetical protein
MKSEARLCAVLTMWYIVTHKTRLRVDELLKENPFFTGRWRAQISAGTPDSDRGAFLFALPAIRNNSIRITNFVRYDRQVSTVEGERKEHARNAPRSSCERRQLGIGRVSGPANKFRQ